jgi:hypothetical protein
LTQLVIVGFTRNHDFHHTHPYLPRGLGDCRHDDARQRDGVLPNVPLIRDTLAEPIETSPAFL